MASDALSGPSTPSPLRALRCGLATIAVIVLPVGAVCLFSTLYDVVFAVGLGRPWWRGVFVPPPAGFDLGRPSTWWIGLTQVTLSGRQKGLGDGARAD